MSLLTYARATLDFVPPTRASQQTYVPPTGATHVVHQGDDLQAALNACAPGDEVVVEYGATFPGEYTIPAGSADTGKRTLRTSAMESLPPEGTRVTPANAGAMFKIRGPVNASTPLQTAAGAHDWQIIGAEIDFDPSVTLSYYAFWIGVLTGITSYAQMPRRIHVGRCYIHGNGDTLMTAGLALHGADLVGRDNYVDSILGTTQDAQAICTSQGVGPYFVDNNFMSSTGENWMSGGGESNLPGQCPADLTFTRNHCYKAPLG